MADSSTNSVETPALQTGAFSYEGLDATAIAIVSAAADAVRDIMRRNVKDVGTHLLRAKDALPHGQFEGWVKAMLAMSARTARNYMSAAGWLDGKPETLADLPPTVLYALAAPDAPPEIVRDVVVAVEAGAPLATAVIRDRLAVADAERADLARAQRKNPKITAAEMRARQQRERIKIAAESEKRKAETERREAECRERLFPLAQRVAALGQGDARALLAMLVGPSWDDRGVFERLLRSLIDGTEAPDSGSRV